MAFTNEDRDRLTRVDTVITRLEPVVSKHEIEIQNIKLRHARWMGGAGTIGVIFGGLVEWLTHLK